MSNIKLTLNVGQLYPDIVNPAQNSNKNRRI